MAKEDFSSFSTLESSGCQCVGVCVCAFSVFSQRFELFRRLFGENFRRWCQMESCSTVYADSHCLTISFRSWAKKSSSAVEQQVEDPPAVALSRLVMPSRYNASNFTVHACLMRFMVWRKFLLQSIRRVANKSCRVQLKFHARWRYTLNLLRFKASPYWRWFKTSNPIKYEWVRAGIDFLIRFARFYFFCSWNCFHVRRAITF